jgi:hypothetical protein
LKAYPLAGVGVRVTSLFAAAEMEHAVVLLSAPLVMVQVLIVVPTWSLTVPLPPLGDTLDILILNGPLLNLAVTVRSTPIFTVQVPVPVQVATVDDQPANAWPLRGTAFKVTEVVLLKKLVHPGDPVAPVVMVQLIPVGVDVTLPLPLPEAKTVSLWLTVAAREEGSVTSVVSWQA